MANSSPTCRGSGYPSLFYDEKYLSYISLLNYLYRNPGTSRRKLKVSDQQLKELCKEKIINYNKVAAYDKYFFLTQKGEEIRNLLRKEL